MSAKLAEIERRLGGLVARFGGGLPQHQLDSVQKLVSAGEPGVALECYCTQLDEYEVSVPSAVLDEIEALGRAMGIAEEYWTRLRRAPEGIELRSLPDELGDERGSLARRWHTREGRAELERLLTAIRRGEPCITESIEDIDEVGNRRDLRGAPLAGRDLSGLDLRDWSLGEADLSGALLSGAKLDRAWLDDAVLEDAQLREASLVGALLSGACCRGTDFRGADARHANFLFADLEGALFDGADLRFARLPERDWTEPAELTSSDGEEELEQAIASLYAAFARYPAPASPSLSPYINVEPEIVERLRVTPVRRNDRDDLERYAQHALNTWGDEDELRHHLPRILELVARGECLDPEQIFRVLSVSDWRSWPRRERQCIETFTEALFHFVLARFPAAPDPREILSGVALIGDVRRPLSIWDQDRSRPASLHLARFIEFERGQLWRLGKLDSYWPEPARTEISHWLRSPPIASRLEETYFADPEAAGADLLAAASDILASCPAPGR